MESDVGAALVAARLALLDSGVANASNEARWLLESAVSNTGGPVTSVDLARFAALVERRCTREPLQHVLGRAAFRHLDLRVGPGVFVPRPETETLVELVLDHAETHHATTVVDLCSGSGAIALALAVENPVLDVTAVERSPAAMWWLHANIDEQDADVRQRMTATLGDVSSPELRRELERLAARTDIVVVNPPYVPQDTTVDPEVGFDPPDAVFAGPDGLSLMPAVTDLARFLLRPTGLVAIEHSETHADRLTSHLRDTGWRDIIGHDDLAGRPRFITARAPVRS